MLRFDFLLSVSTDQRRRPPFFFADFFAAFFFAGFFFEDFLLAFFEDFFLELFFAAFFGEAFFLDFFLPLAFFPEDLEEPPDPPPDLGMSGPDEIVSSAMITAGISASSSSSSSS